MPPAGVESSGFSLQLALWRSWAGLRLLLVAFGLSWAALGVSLCLVGLPGASGSDFGAILEPFWESKSTMFEAFFRTSRGCSLACFSLSVSCAGALKFVLFALGAKRAPKQIHWKTQWMFMIFPSLLGRRGRREEGRRGSKREQKQHTQILKATQKT